MGSKKAKIYDFFRSAIMEDEENDDLKDKQFTKDIKAFYNTINDSKDVKGFGDFLKLFIQSEKVALDHIEKESKDRFIDIEFVDRRELAMDTIEHNQNLITQIEEAEDE